MTKINYLLGLLIITLSVSFTNLFSLANGKNITSNQETNLNFLMAENKKGWDIEQMFVELIRIITGEKPIPPQRSPFCPIFPTYSDTYSETIKKQPIFIWSGDDYVVYKIKIKNHQTKETLPTYVLEKDDQKRQTVIYPTNLSVGEYAITYYYKSVENNDNDNNKYLKIRLKLTIKNENLEIPNFDNLELTHEEVAWKKADYYRKNKYYAEAIQEVFSVKNPSNKEQYEKQLKEAGKIACRKE